MKAVFVLVVDLPEEDLQRAAGVFHENLSQGDFDGPGGRMAPPLDWFEKYPGAKVLVAKEASAEMVLEVFAEPEPGGGRHVVKVDPHGGWALEHSLACRQAGLLNCPLTKLVALAVEENHISEGSHRVWIEQYGDGSRLLRWDE